MQKGYVLSDVSQYRSLSQFVMHTAAINIIVRLRLTVFVGKCFACSNIAHSHYILMVLLHPQLARLTNM